MNATYLQLTGNGSGPSNQDGGVSRDDRDPNNSKKQEALICTLCNLVFNDPKDKILEGAVCNSHKCAKCLKLNNSQYTTTQRVDLMWLCSVQCRERVSRMSRPSSIEGNNVTTDVNDDVTNIIANTASKIVEVVAETLNKSVVPDKILADPANLNAGEPDQDEPNEHESSWAKVVNTRVKQTKAIMKEAIVEHAKEKAQDEERKRNIIIYWFPECGDDDQDKRKDYDKSLFEKLSKNELGIAGVKLTTIIRLGKRDPELTRPLLVTMPTFMDKRKIMAILYKLKNASEDFNNISVSNDLTKEERQERQNLVQ